LNLSGQWRLRDEQTFRRSAKAQFLGSGDEVSQLPEFDIYLHVEVRYRACDT